MGTEYCWAMEKWGWGGVRTDAKEETSPGLARKARGGRSPGQPCVPQPGAARNQEGFPETQERASASRRVCRQALLLPPILSPSRAHRCLRGGLHDCLTYPEW